MCVSLTWLSLHVQRCKAIGVTICGSLQRMPTLLTLFRTGGDEAVPMTVVQEAFAEKPPLKESKTVGSQRP